MSSHPDLPPNPREAKYRRAPMHWGAYPVTVFLIVVSVGVAALSRIGVDTSRIGGFFFASPATEEEWNVIWKETWGEYVRSHASEEVTVQDFAGKLKEQVEEGALPDKLQQALDARLQRNNFAGVLKGEVWRLVTPMFIHFGAMHIFFNMMWLWDFGRVLEARFRGLRFALLVAAVSMAANVAQAFFSGPNFGGMSGVNYGLFGFILIRQKFHPAGDIRLNPQTVPFLLIWLVVCFTGSVGNVANGAHVAGLVAGGVIGWVNAMLGGGWAAIKRRRDFQRTLSRSDAVLHTCAVCKKTEHDDPNLDFRIGHDGEEYCTDHLPPAA